MQVISFHPQVILAYTEVSDGNMDPRFSRPKDVRTHRDQAFSTLKLVAADVIEAEQIHSTRLLPLNSENSKMWKGMNVTGVDGFLTDQNEFPMMIKVADCAPVAFYDPQHQVGGLIHAGKAGAIDQIHTQTLTRMATLYHTDPAQVLVWLGPTIGSCCYRFDTLPEELSSDRFKPFISKNGKQVAFDLPGLIRQEILDAGVKKSHFKQDNRCTFDDEALYSHAASVQAKSSVPEGRFVVIFKLK